MLRARLAAALLIPGSTATEIDGLRRALGSNALPRIAPHVTLVPPVNVREDRLDDAHAVLARAAGAIGPLALQLGPPATFWPANPVVYLAVTGDVDAVAVLRTALLVDPLERPDQRPFVPHVTIDEHVEPDAIPAALGLLASYRTDVTVERVHLLRSDPATRVWHAIASAPLGGPRVVGRGGLPVSIDVTDVLDPEAAAFFDRAWEAHRQASAPEPPTVRRYAVVARREGAVVGVALGTIDDQLLLDRLVVDAAARGQGIGDRLLAEVAELARGADRSVLLCQAESPARAWYEARGWVVDIELPDWRRGVDFVRMTRA